MIGVVLVVLAVVVALPLLFWVSFGVLSYLLGRLLHEEAEVTHPGSELIATNY